MTGNVSHNLGEFSVHGTERDTQKSMQVKSQNVKKRNQMNHSTFMRQRTGDMNDLT